jgi:hypothetical protein
VGEVEVMGWVEWPLILLGLHQPFPHLTLQSLPFLHPPSSFSPQGPSKEPLCTSPSQFPSPCLAGREV